MATEDRRGRPALPDAERLGRKVPVMLHQGMYMRLRERAKALGVSIGEVIRRAIAAFLHGGES